MVIIFYDRAIQSAMTCGDLSPVGVLRSIINTYRPPLLTNDDQRSPSAPTPVPRSSPVPPTRTVFSRSPGVTGRMQREGGPPTPTVLDGLGLRRHQLPAPPPVRPSERQNRLVSRTHFGRNYGPPRCGEPTRRGITRPISKIGPRIGRSSCGDRA